MSNLRWYLSVEKILDSIRDKSADAQRAAKRNKESKNAKTLNGYIHADKEELVRLWADAKLARSDLGNLSRHIGFGDPHDYDDILERDLPEIKRLAQAHAMEGKSSEATVGFIQLLHPTVIKHSLKHYKDGNYREAVLNAAVAISDLLRKRTGIDADGTTLIAAAFSLERPHLIFSDLDTESGKSDQKGFLQIFQGMYIGIRNPKAHSLKHDLDETKAAQYLVFLSLLARRIFEAKEVRPMTAAKARSL